MATNSPSLLRGGNKIFGNALVGQELRANLPAKEQPVRLLFVDQVVPDGYFLDRDICENVLHLIQQRRVLVVGPNGKHSIRILMLAGLLKPRLGVKTTTLVT